MLQCADTDRKRSWGMRVSNGEDFIFVFWSAGGIKFQEREVGLKF